MSYLDSHVDYDPICILRDIDIQSFQEYLGTEHSRDTGLDFGYIRCHLLCQNCGDNVTNVMGKKKNY